VFVPRSFWAKALPKHPALAVPVASCAGVILPGCECGSVPIAGSLIRRGVTPSAALAFLLAAPAINPIVLTSTAVAFPNNPEMVVGRGVASLIVAMVMGWLWLRLGRPEWIRLPRRPDLDDLSKGRAFWAAVRHDVVHAGGFLVLGAMAAATINILIPAKWMQWVADKPALGVIAMAILAVLLSLCSEADAFVAASLSQFSLTARLVFLVVGPAVGVIGSSAMPQMGQLPGASRTISGCIGQVHFTPDAGGGRRRASSRGRTRGTHLQSRTRYSARDATGARASAGAARSRARAALRRRSQNSGSQNSEFHLWLAPPRGGASMNSIRLPTSDFCILTSDSEF